MTYVCEKCGYKDNPIWKPLFWKMYYSYCDFDDFSREYPELAERLSFEQTTTDQHYFYKTAGKTRRMVHRVPKAFAMMTKRELYEKTPSEKGFTVNGEKRT